MAQVRANDWRGPATSALLNMRWYEGFGNLVLNGLSVVPGSTGMKVTIQTGTGLVAGLTFSENATLTDVLTLSNGHASLPRIDTVVAEYTREETSPAPEVIYKVVAGTPNATPSRPTVATNQIRLADVYVEALKSIVTEDMITLPQKARDRFQALVQEGVLTEREMPLYIEGVMWQRSTDPNDDPTIVVLVGDLWCDTGDDPPSYYSWDGTYWLDIQDWNNLKNRPATLPPEVHELAGEAHTGQLPIARVSGHTAFGPPAHQEAFAMSLLRRP